MERASRHSSTRRAHILGDIGLRPSPRGGAWDQLRDLKRLGEIDPSGHELLVVWNRDDDLSWLFYWQGEMLPPFWLGRKLMVVGMAAVSHIEIAAGGGARRMRNPVLLRRNAGFRER